MAARILVFLFVSLLAFCTELTSASASEFNIGPGDIIAIDVYNERDLSLRAKVDQSGVLRIPLLGDIQVAGKTSKQLGKELELAYIDGYLVDPSVSVVIESYRPFFIRGAVSKAGVYDFETSLTVDQAIAIAGGLKDRASKRDWYIIRDLQKEKIKVTKESKVFPGDIIEIEESLF
ncbi:MAG: protein involved in polysaccharide export with SLBB domain [Gammaproteobacteria bacterium]